MSVDAGSTLLTPFTESGLLGPADREELVRRVSERSFGLGPLEMLLKDNTISDIMINGPKNVYVERRGLIEKTPVVFRDNNHLMQIIDRIVSKVGRRVDETSPMVDARLPDGSIHDGYFEAIDIGAAIQNKRIDIFTAMGDQSEFFKRHGLTNMKATAVYKVVE